MLRTACGSREFLLLILIFAFFVRFAGIQFGLPHLYHADEPIVVNHAMAYGTGDLNPHFFKIPPLVSYLLFIIYGLFYLLAHSLGAFQTTEDFLRFFINDPTLFYLIARIAFGAFAGTATVFALYVFNKKNFSETHALIAAFFLAVSFLHVRDSHYAYTDILLILVLVLCFIQIFKIFITGSRRSHICFGLLAGVATAIKYNGILILIPFCAAYFLKWAVKPAEKSKERFGISNLAIFLMCFILSCVLLNPFSVLDFKFFITEVFHQTKAENFVGLTHHLTRSLIGGLGLPLFLFALAGTAASLLRFEPKRVILLSFVFGYYLILVFVSQRHERYVLPLIPFVVFFASDALIKLIEKTKMPKWIYPIAAILIAFPSMIYIYHSNRIFLETDVRTLAKTWIEKHVPAEAKIALEYPFLMPRLNPTISQLQEKADHFLMKEPGKQVNLKRIAVMLEEAEKAPNLRYELFFLSDSDSGVGFSLTAPVISYDVSKLTERKISYVVIAKTSKQKHNDFYRELEKRGKLLVEFNPFADSGRTLPIDGIPLTGGPFVDADLKSRNRNGQIIEIYRL